MARIDLAELRENLDYYINRAIDGHEITLIECGKTVARIIPTGPTKLDQMIEQGLVAPARKRKEDILPPPVKTSGTVSDLITDQRSCDTPNKLGLLRCGLAS